jgi:hypothetical protein
VTGAAIVRDDSVRKHFDAIVWLPLGQNPMITKMQNLCHMQCMGVELSAELSSEEKQQALQQAMAGKKILLVRPRARCDRPSPERLDSHQNRP